MKYAIVFTTINYPEPVLKSYYQNLVKFDHLKDTEFIIIGDNKTPDQETRTLAYTYSMHRGLMVNYWGVERQKGWLRDFPALDKIIPYNSDCRRNIGYLLAAQQGAEVIISIDDDNYAHEDDFVGCHTNPVPEFARASTNRWVNICNKLCTDLSPHRDIYPRGFPYNKRDYTNPALKIADARLKVDPSSPIMVNEGLWLDAPDVDAVCNLESPCKVVDTDGCSITLEKGNWSVINTQNTSFKRELLPCWFFMPMGFQYNGFTVDRYADIWLGYLVQKCMHTVGGAVAYGLPVVRHIRNKHDYLKDLQVELGGMIMTQYLVEYLERITLTPTDDYATAYMELGTKLEAEARDRENGLSVQGRIYFSSLRQDMEVWLETCAIIMR